MAPFYSSAVYWALPADSPPIPRAVADWSLLTTNDAIAGIPGEQKWQIGGNKGACRTNIDRIYEVKLLYEWFE